MPKWGVTDALAPQRSGQGYCAASRRFFRSVPMARILYLTQIEIDHGAIAVLPQECERIGMRRPLVVTDAGVRAAGVLDLALEGSKAIGGLPYICTQS